MAYSLLKSRSDGLWAGSATDRVCPGGTMFDNQNAAGPTRRSGFAATSPPEQSGECFFRRGVWLTNLRSTQATCEGASSALHSRPGGVRGMVPPPTGLVPVERCLTTRTQLALRAAPPGRLRGDVAAKAAWRDFPANAVTAQGAMLQLRQRLGGRGGGGWLCRGLDGDNEAFEGGGSALRIGVASDQHVRFWIIHQRVAGSDVSKAPG